MCQERWAQRRVAAKAMLLLLVVEEAVVPVRFGLDRPRLDRPVERASGQGRARSVNRRKGARWISRGVEGIGLRGWQTGPASGMVSY